MSTIDCRMGRYQSPFGSLIANRLGDALGFSLCNMNCYGDVSFWVKAHCITGLNDGDGITSVPGGNGIVGQAVVANRPTWHSDAANGMPAIRFNGTSQFFNIAAGAAPGTEYTILMVVKTNVTTGARSILEFYNHVGPTGINVYPINGVMKHYHSDGAGGQSQVITTGTLTGAWQMLTIQSEDQDTHRFYIDTIIKQNSTTDQEVVFDNDPGMVGAHDGGSGATDFYSGDIAEMVAFREVLDNDTRLAAELCLMNKYGIPVP